MKKAHEEPEDFRTQLARDFLIACMANYQGVTFRTAQGYVKGKKEVGGLWLLLADIAIQSLNEGFNDLYGNEVKEKKAKQDNVIPFGRVD